MLRKKTLFVVGAGASTDFNLPTGAILRDQIAAALDIRFADWGQDLKAGDADIAQMMIQHSRKSPNPNQAMSLLQKSAWQIRDAMNLASSIDQYLDVHDDDEAKVFCGKLAIARIILDAEQNSKLADDRDKGREFALHRAKGTWLGKLFPLMTNGFHPSNIDGLAETISFIVFNYDRCIEHFLQRTLAEYFVISPQKSQEIVQKIPIYHPYGQVGHLPWQTPAAHQVRFGYMSGLARTTLIDIAGEIRTFTERVEDKSDTLSAMTEELASAKTIVFLGFAYYEQNLRLLDIKAASSCERIYGTAKGMSTSDIRLVSADLKERFVRSSNARLWAPEVELLDTSCSDFFDEYGRSLAP